MQHGGGDRVRAQGEPTDGVDLSGAQPGVLEQVEHHVPDEGCGAVVQGDPPQVDVVGGARAGGKSDLAVHDGQLGDQGAQLVARARCRQPRGSSRRPGYLSAASRIGRHRRRSTEHADASRTRRSLDSARMAARGSSRATSAASP